jgi:hypothetical protein
MEWNHECVSKSERSVGRWNLHFLRREQFYIIFWSRGVVDIVDPSQTLMCNQERRFCFQAQILTYVNFSCKIQKMIEMMIQRELTFQNFYKVWTSSFQRPNPLTSSSMQYKGGWEFPQDSFYFFHIFLFGNTITFCIIELFAIMPSYVLYNMDILCYNLLCFVRNVPYLGFLLSIGIQQ